LEQQRQQLRFQREQHQLATRAAREQERAQRADERATAQAERDQRARHVERQLAEAAEQTRAVQETIAAFDNVLLNGIRRSAQVDFDQLRRPVRAARFQPGQLAVPNQQPQWAAYAPPPPTGLGRVFGKSTHDRAVREASERFRQAVAQYEAVEHERLAKLADAQHRYDENERWRRQEIEKINNQVSELERGFLERQPPAVEDYFELVAEASPLPAGLPVNAEVAYQPEARRVLIVRELPNVDVIPEAQEFRYIRTRDEIDTKQRTARDIRQRYASLIAQIVLLTMRDVLDVQPADLVDEVAVNGHVSTRNKATGQPERPCLVSVAASREQFAQLVLTELDPIVCLRFLNALVSPHPYDLEPVRPVFDPDLSKYRFVTEMDAAAGLDARQVLLDMRPVEFEHLIRQLFEAMGMQSWVTQASRDDGVDAVAVNEDPIMGGLCVVQAKRYKNIVPADAVRALAGVMDDKRASRGVLVTTSWFGKATHEFATRHGRIQLIEGGNLKQLLAEHLNLDVVIGELNRRTRST
jgi:restriction system protein